MTFPLRPAHIPADYPRMAALLGAEFKQPVTVETLAEEDAGLPAGAIKHRLVAVDETGLVVGYAHAFRYPNTRAGKFYVMVVSDRARRRQGIGTALFGAIEETARAEGGSLFVGDVEDDDPASRAYVEKRGYAIRRHGFYSGLDLTTYDPQRFAGVVEQAQAGGIRFLTLADEPGETSERKLYTLLSRTMPDIPGYEAASFMPYETYQKWILQNESVRPDLVLLAADGDRFVGVSILNTTPEASTLYTPHTSVDPEYRGRKIALALKLLAIETGRRLGMSRMTTGNDSLNAPMLEVNRKLGYVPQAGSYEVVRSL